MTTCLLSLATRNPTFCSARTASRWLMPGIFGTSTGDLDLANIAVSQQVVANRQVLPDGVSNVGQGLILRLPLRPATGQSRTRNGEALVGLLQGDSVFHR